jgi:hypothetical protein
MGRLACGGIDIVSDDVQADRHMYWAAAWRRKQRPRLTRGTGFASFLSLDHSDNRWLWVAALGQSEIAIRSAIR